jgi:hypothetical protein
VYGSQIEVIGFNLKVVVMMLMVMEAAAAAPATTTIFKESALY